MAGVPQVMPAMNRGRSRERGGARDREACDRYEQEEPHCSWQDGPRRDREEWQSPAEERADELVRDAEASKARIYGTPGISPHCFNFNNDFVHSAMVDESYMLVAAHLDESIVTKIGAREIC